MFFKMQNIYSLGNCHQDYWYQPGTTAQILTKTLIVHYCQMNCQNSSNCVAFNYNKLTMTCELLSQVSGAPTKNPVYKTGPKVCGQSTGTKTKKALF